MSFAEYNQTDRQWYKYDRYGDLMAEDATVSEWRLFSDEGSCWDAVRGLWYDAFYYEPAIIN